MIVVAYARTMKGAKQIVPDEPIKLRREDRIAPRGIDALRPTPPQPAPPPPVPEDKRVPKTEIQRIIADIAQKHGLSYAALMSKSRSRQVTAARDEAIAAVYALKPQGDKWALSLPVIGRIFGGKDHTTILSALRRHAKRKEA